jgi:dihydroorotase
MDETSLLDFNAYGKVNPPLRTKDDVQAILKGISDGTIDVISSDHKPDTIDSKDIEFELASYGISSFETAFSLAYTRLVDTKLITMEQLVQKMSYKPSQILAIPKGKIALDAVADLVIFDPNASFLVEARNFESKANYSPYDGMILKGLIKYTIVGGKKYNANTDVVVLSSDEFDMEQFEGYSEY